MHRVLFLALIGVFFSSCEPKKEVRWGALSTLDNHSVLLEGAAFHQDLEEQKRLLLECGKMIKEVLDTIPLNAKDGERVEFLLNDLKALALELDGLEQLNPGEVGNISKSVHPIVTQLMTAAGVPHKHETK